MNRHTTKPVLIAAAVALAIGSSSAAAAVIGQVLFAKGEVQIVGSDGSTRPAKRGEPVEDGERIVTGPGALGQVKMRDGGYVGVRPNSRMRFATAPAAGAPRVIELDDGNVRVLNVKLSENSNPLPVMLKTPQGQVEVNDADTLAAIVPGTGTGGGKQTLFRLDRGTGTASDGKGVTRTIRRGEALSVKPGLVAVVANDLQPRPVLPPSSVTLPSKVDPLGRTPGAASKLTLGGTSPFVPADRTPALSSRTPLTGVSFCTTCLKPTETPRVGSKTGAVVQNPVVYAASKGGLPSLEVTRDLTSPTITTRAVTSLTTAVSGTRTTLLAPVKTPTKGKTTVTTSPLVKTPIIGSTRKTVISRPKIGGGRISFGRR